MIKKLIIFNYLETLHLNMSQCKRYYSSFLYVSGDRARDVYSIVQPYIDFEERIQNFSQLDVNIKKRQVNVNLHDLKKSWEFYKTRLDFKHKLEVNKNQLKSNLEKLYSNKDNLDENEIERLKLKFQLVKDDLKSISKTVWDIENNLLIKVLKLPNDLHCRVPDSETVIRSFKEAPLVGHGHLEVGKKFNCLDYYNNSCYYLKNDLALFEIIASQYFVEQFINDNKFVKFSNPDFSRSVLIEGCTTKTNGENIAFLLKDTEKNQQHKLYLNGGASFLSFFGFHSKQIVNSNDLPVRYISQGRHYCPKSGNNFNGLYSVWQSDAVELFIGSSSDHELVLEMDDVVEKLINIYKSLDIHFRIVNIPAEQLQPWESLRYSFQLYSPVNQGYAEVGNISLISDFISKRLQAYYLNAKNDVDFLKVVSGTVVKIPILIANLLEMSDNDLCIPKIIRNKFVF